MKINSLIIDNKIHRRSVEEVINTIGIDLSKYNINAKQIRQKGFSLKINQEEVDLEYSNLPSLYNALLELSVNNQEQLLLEKEMFNSELGLMIDCARNSVMTVSALKRFVCNSALMGYTYLKIYVEDCMKLDGEEFFGYMRGAYSKEEFKEINEYCEFIGIELVPCIQTLAHLNQIFKWKEYRKINDYDDILLVDDNQTYELIEKMVQFSRECTTSKRINIGMDEAAMLGLGKYLSKHGFRNRFEIMKEHLIKVIAICKKYDFYPEMWSDMYFKLAFNDQYYISYSKIDQSIKDFIPEGVHLIYWDYYHHYEKDYLDMIKNHKQLQENCTFAGGIWTWRGYVPFNKYSETTMFPAISACRKEKVNDIFFTMWGDNGGECSRFSTLSSMLILSEKCYHEKIDLDKVSRMLKVISGYYYEEWLLLDEPNNLYNNKGMFNSNPSKFLLFNDLFVSSFDEYAKEDTQEFYNETFNKLANLAKVDSPYNYLFEVEANLSKALSYKANLSVRIKEAYDKRNLDKLKECLEDIKQSIKYLQAFYDSYKKQWNLENKPFGFEIQDIRIGGLIFRLEHNYEVLNKFINGEKTEIAELNEARKSISQENGHLLVYNNYAFTVSSCKL